MLVPEGESDNPHSLFDLLLPDVTRCPMAKCPAGSVILLCALVFEMLTDSAIGAFRSHP